MKSRTLCFAVIMNHQYSRSKYSCYRYMSRIYSDISFRGIHLHHVRFAFKKSSVRAHYLERKFIICHKRPPLFALGKYVIYASAVKEIALRNIIIFTFKNFSESLYGLADRNISSFKSRKLCSHEERL